MEMKKTDIKKLIGENIRHLRESLDLSQAELAKKCGWQSESGKGAGTRIYNYETGYREPSFDDILKLAVALKTTPAAILNFNGNEIKDGLRVESQPDFKFYPLLTIGEVLDWKSNPTSNPNRVIKMIHLQDSNYEIGSHVLDLTDEFRKLGANSGFFSNRRIYGIFKLSGNPENEDIVIVKINNDLIIRRYMKDGTIVILESLNLNSPDIHLKDDIEIIAIAKNIYNGEAEIIENN